MQTDGCAPLARAWQARSTVGARAEPRWDECMWPWEDEPHSAADGILDDETYDWLGRRRRHAAAAAARPW